MNCFRPWVLLDTNTGFHFHNHTTGLSSGPKWNVFHGMNSILCELLNHIPKPLHITFQFSMIGRSLRRGPALLFKTILILTPRKDSFCRSSFRSLVASLKALIKAICTIPTPVSKYRRVQLLMPSWTKATTILKAHTSSWFKSIFAWPVFPTIFYTLQVNIDLHLKTDRSQCDLTPSPHSFATLHQSHPYC